MTKLTGLLIGLLFLAACDGKPAKNDTAAGIDTAPQIQEATADSLLALQLRVQRHPRDLVLKERWKRSARQKNWLYVWGVARSGQANRAMLERALKTDAKRWVLSGQSAGAQEGTSLRGTVSGTLLELRRVFRGDSVCVLYAYKTGNP
ncbi:MAG TPA: hypothetical protein ENJ10_05860 [Caldithrix abyssi]|uniref:Lipoprotein n=1 Tax=Caldithrix abyssi TaxID=187145 RepID=A0A7V1LMH7_CALAY|nr:hypothetical protein [Caldithrix abyssi]